MKRRGFTLTELLAVIAVIGVLAALLVPVLGRVRESGKAAQCSANLRQIGAGFLLYASDHGNRLPPSYIVSSGSPSNNWWYHIAPYIGFAEKTYDWPDLQRISSVDGPLRCPAADLSDTVNYPTLTWSSYKMSQRYRLASPEGPGTTRGLLVSSIKRPARSIMIADGRTHPEFSNYISSAKAGGLVYPHGGSLNALFADGHVEPFKEAGLAARWQDVYTDF